MKKQLNKSEECAQPNADTVLPGRRRVLELMGMTALAVPVLGLQACGGGDDTGSAASAAPEPAALKPAPKAEASMAESINKTMESAKEDVAESMDMAEQKVDETIDQAMTESKTIATDAMAKVDEAGGQAVGLGYRHDATTVENARYKAGQQCSNCVLYQGGDSEWGGCPLFAGQQVKATGWCSAYAAAS
jgi:hypothetical protein